MRFWVYFAISGLLFSSAVAYTMTTYANYFTALLGLSDTVVGIVVVVNFALCLTALWTKFVIALFLNHLSSSEMQSIYQRGWIFLCNSLLYWGTINGDLYMNPFNLGVCVLSILVIFVLHWVCRMRVKGLQAVADTQLTWRRILTIARLGTLCLLLFVADVLLCYTALQSLGQHNYALQLFGLFIVDQLEMSIAFCLEFIINVRGLVFLHMNPDEDWEPARMLSCVSLLFSSFVAVSGHTLFVYVFGFRTSDIGSLLGRLMRLCERVGGAVKVFTAKSEITEFTTAATAEELDRDNTCVICREEMSLSMANHAKDAPRTLHCGHVMHSKCLTAWISQSATCPTCRRNVRPPTETAAAPAQAPRPVQQPVQPVQQPQQPVQNPVQQPAQQSQQESQHATSQTQHTPLHNPLYQSQLPQSGQAPESQGIQQRLSNSPGIAVHQVDIRQVEIQQVELRDTEIQRAELRHTDHTYAPGQTFPSGHLDGAVSGPATDRNWTARTEPPDANAFDQGLCNLLTISIKRHSPASEEPMFGEHIREFSVQRRDSSHGVIEGQFEFSLQ